LRCFLAIHDGQENRTADLIEEVFVDPARRHTHRPGGYTRIIKVGRRSGDNAAMPLFELLSESEPAGNPCKANARRRPTRLRGSGASAGGEEETGDEKTANKTRAKKAKKEEAGKGEGAQARPWQIRRLVGSIGSPQAPKARACDGPRDRKRPETVQTPPAGAVWGRGPFWNV
jgi:hypothetical protein